MSRPARPLFDVDPDAAYFGWLGELPAGRWYRVSGERDWGSCWTALRLVSRQLGLHSTELIVLPAGRTPEKKGRAKRPAAARGGGG